MRRLINEIDGIKRQPSNNSSINMSSINGKLDRLEKMVIETGSRTEKMNLTIQEQH